MMRVYGHSIEYMGDKTVYIINFILYFLDTARIMKILKQVDQWTLVPTVRGLSDDKIQMINTTGTLIWLNDDTNNISSLSP